MGSKFRFLRHPAKSLLICIRSLENKSEGSKAMGRAVTMAVFKTGRNSQMSKKSVKKGVKNTTSPIFKPNIIFKCSKFIFW